jgi:hypothetical protein
MNDQPPVSAAGTEKEYDIRYEPAEERVRVEFNGTWVADSSNAVICYETRAPRMFYFPFEDVNQEYLEKTNFAGFWDFIFSRKKSSKDSPRSAWECQLELSVGLQPTTDPQGLKSSCSNQPMHMFIWHLPGALFCKE